MFEAGLIPEGYAKSGPQKQRALVGLEGYSMLTHMKPIGVEEQSDKMTKDCANASLDKICIVGSDKAAKHPNRIFRKKLLAIFFKGIINAPTLSRSILK